MKRCDHDQEIPQSHQQHLKEQPHTYQSRDTRKTNKVKRPALSLFPIKIISKLLRTQSNAQQNMDTRDHRMGATINNESIEIEPSPKNRL